MKYRDSYSRDDDFLRAVETGTLERFGHREHLQLAYLCARAATTLDDVVLRCRGAIRRVAAAKGTPGMYHETITAAWASIMLDAVRALPDAGFDDLLATRPELADRSYLARFYTPERLGSEIARAVRLAPDRAPLPVPTPPGARSRSSRATT